MEVSGPGKSPTTTLSFRYNANNEELEELFNACDDDPPTPQCDPPCTSPSENASPKKGDKTPSIIDKYFKSIRTEKTGEKEKVEDVKASESKTEKEEGRSPSMPKEISSSPMKEYFNRLGKRSTPEASEVKDGSNETWKIFHDFKFKISQAVEDIKTRSLEETKEKSVLRDNSVSDSEENSAVKDVDQQSFGDTDNQVSSLESSIQNLSEITQPITAKAAEQDLSLPTDNKNSESSDDTHKNLPHSEAEDNITDSLMDIESGIEALEDTMEDFVEGNKAPPTLEQNIIEPSPNQPPLVAANCGIPPSQTNLKDTIETKPKAQILNVTMYIITFFLIISYVLFPNSSHWNGFILGIWFVCLARNTGDWFMDTFFGEGDEPRSFVRLKRSAIPLTYTIPSVKEHTPLKKYEGWINHYRYPDYDPTTYHINKTTTAFMKLEGCNLRISYSKTKITKRALWDEKIEHVTFYQHRLYSLNGARVSLLPKGLVQRRQWSKKYPICVILSDKEKIQVLEKENTTAERKYSEAVVDKVKKELQTHETESTETNTSPEKKKKFVWRRKEKSVTHTEGEPGREGLRHRLVRKMHRDKKTDSVSTITEPVEPQTQDTKTVQFEDTFEDLDISARCSVSKDDVYELDDTELSRIKEFLEETEMESGADSPLEGEWSVHMKNSHQSVLFFFARTGRDKYEWYRRLIIAISEAKSADSSASDDKSNSDSSKPTEGKDIELSVFRADKDTVAFAKNPNKPDSICEGPQVTISSLPNPFETDSYEKTFWPYLMKIIQTHEKSMKRTSEMGVMCQIEPTPHERLKNKKKKKCDTKPSSEECDCRLLPSEVAWVNTMLARVMFDVMRDPNLIARVQNRIQKKLNTLKLPSFMSPLLVTELSLSGACPLIERVCTPTWDARGLWFDADLRYDGGAFIVLLTQINLMKLKEKNLTLEEQLLVQNANVPVNDISGSPSSSYFDKHMRRKSAAFDSEIEDSAESSSDDETPPMQPVDSNINVPLSDSTSALNTEGGSSKKKFLRMVDKIATNKYFQQVTDYKYVKRAMEGLSNTDIKLHLEVHGLEGRLTLNLPPPPHDRLWIGFRTNPQLILKARPAVGARTLRFAHISNWIEQKLSKEFEKVFVLPNMEDIIIDVMTPTPVDTDD